MRLTFSGTRDLDSLITRADLKTHLRVEHTAEDDLIDALRAAAADYIENFCSVKLGVITAQGYLDSFVASYIPYGPVTNVGSVEYKATDNASTYTALSSSSYFVDKDTQPARIDFYNVPSLGSYNFNAVKVTISLGYLNDPPEAFKHATRLLVAHWYENRQAEIVGTISSAIKFGVDALLNPYRIIQTP